MTTEEQRIAFAEERGYADIHRRTRSFKIAPCGVLICGTVPHSSHGGEYEISEIPDPFTNANDAEAIVEYMRRKRWSPYMTIPEDEYYFQFSKDAEMYQGTGQNMRQAICSAFAAYIQSKQPCA